MDKQNFTNQQIIDFDHHHNLHPYMDYKGNRLIIDKGQGAYVYDQDGKKYLDGIGGLWCVNIGHGRSELAEASQMQSGQLAYFSTFVIFSNRPSSILAKTLSDLAPGDLNHVYFTTGGSEANDAAVRTIHHYNILRNKPQKRHIISRHLAYHGMTYLTASISGIHDNNTNYHTITDFIHHISTPNCYRPQSANKDPQAYCDYLVAEFESKINELGADNVAAFFAEPIMGAGGVFVAPAGYHKRMWQVCQKYDILYVSDEVVTAFCRLGHFFSSKEVFEVQPDIITFAKGVSSGYAPLGGVLISDKIYEGIQKGSFTTAYTYSAHPMCCAVANRNIELMQDENLCAKVQETSKYLWSELAELQKNCPYLGDVRGSHFMLGLEFVKDKQTKSSFGNDTQFSSVLAKKALDNGLIIRPLSNGINVVSPTLIWSKKEVDLFISILQKSITETIAEFKSHNIL